MQRVKLSSSFVACLPVSWQIVSRPSEIVICRNCPSRQTLWRYQQRLKTGRELPQQTCRRLSCKERRATSELRE
jgi:hypothetical protein